jgi:hypothetical protein
MRKSKNTLRHTIKAIKASRKNGGIKSVKRSKTGTQYNYKNGTGYWVEK